MIKTTIPSLQGLLLMDLLYLIWLRPQNLVVGVLPSVTTYPKTHLLPLVGAIPAPAQHSAASASSQMLEPLTINVSPKDL